MIRHPALAIVVFCGARCSQFRASGGNLGAQTSAPVVCAKGLSVNPHVDFAQCPPLDYLLVPGGRGTRAVVHNPALLAFIANQAKHCRAVLSVCTGAFLTLRFIASSVRFSAGDGD